MSNTETYIVWKMRLRGVPGTTKNVLRALCFHNARLYNVCLWETRWFRDENGRFPNAGELFQLVKQNENFALIPSDGRTQTLNRSERAHKAYLGLASLKRRGELDEEINLPRFLPKTGLTSLVVAGRACRISKNEDVMRIGLTKQFRETYGVEARDLVLPFPKGLRGKKIAQAQITPLYGGTEFDLVITCKDEKRIAEGLDAGRVLSVDLGVDNLMTCFDSGSLRSFIVDGRWLKSVNRHFNKTMAAFSSKCDLAGVKYNETRRFRKLSDGRNNRVEEALRLAANVVIGYCLANKVGVIVVGDFSGSKRGINLGKVNNQKFVSIPYFRLKAKLRAKCETLGIVYEEVDESYTSKACAYSLDPLPTYKKGEECGVKFSGRRVSRGCYKLLGEDILCNADVNGAVNIFRRYSEQSESKAVRRLSPHAVRAASTGHPRRIFLLTGTQAAQSSA